MRLTIIFLDVKASESLCAVIRSAWYSFINFLSWGSSWNFIWYFRIAFTDGTAVADGKDKAQTETIPGHPNTNIVKFDFEMNFMVVLGYFFRRQIYSCGGEGIRGRNWFVEGLQRCELWFPM